MISTFSSSIMLKLLMLLLIANEASAQFFGRSNQIEDSVPLSAQQSDAKADEEMIAHEEVLETMNDVETTIEELSLPPPPAADLPSEVCTFCDSTDTFDPDLKFAGIACDEWAALSMFAPPGEECTLLRAAAVKFCGCPTTIEETCQLCPNGSEGYNEDQTLSFVQEVTCSDILELTAVDGEETCRYMDRFSYMCGCPGVVPTCSLCGQDDDGVQLQMSRPDEILIHTDKDITTCSDWDKMLSLDPKSDPVGMVAEGRDGSSRCDKALKLSDEKTGLQLAGLCGCPGVDALNVCTPCKDGYAFQDDLEKCDRLGFMAPYMSNTTRCEFIQLAAVEVGCCLPAETSSENLHYTSAPKSNERSAATSLGSFFSMMVTLVASLCLQTKTRLSSVGVQGD